MQKPFRVAALTAIFLGLLNLGSMAYAQERLPWEKQPPPPNHSDPYAPGQQRYANQYEPRVPDNYTPGRTYEPSGRPPPYQRPPQYDPRSYDSGPRVDNAPEYGRPRYRDDYNQADRYDPRPYDPDRYRRDEYDSPDHDRQTYSQSEVVNAGHKFFGSLSKGLAKAVEYVFQSQGRPTGYILGEDAGGAFIAGLRYGEGRLYTKYGASRRVYWQGPSIGYDFGGEGSRTMVLVYGLQRPYDLFRRFGGVQGSAYLIGGASVQLLTNGSMTLAPIRTGVGVRLGGNVGYLKYTPKPTWNPF